jgi:predicted benzoate:H+ symporter BenE
MLDKSPGDYALATYVWVTALALLGGLVTAWKNWLSSERRTYSWAHFGLDLLSSSLAGLITFWLASAAEINQLIVAALVAISGHMGALALNEMRFFYRRWLKSQ